jgi:hypothetical protein
VTGTANARRDAERWFLVGHGSVGSFLAERLSAHGASVLVFDPSPRVPIDNGRRVDRTTLPVATVDYAISCVPPDVAGDVPTLLCAAIGPGGIVFDWNTLAPEQKKRISDAVDGRMIDVALLDSLDARAERPMLAISGYDVARGANVLERYGFSAVVVGDQVGEAARLKYLRSIFMKSLEALVLEYASLAFDVQGQAVVRRSLQNNLGAEFVRFMDLLLETNRIHAARRSRELEDAVATFAGDGSEPELAPAAARVLAHAAEAWSDTAAPPVGADLVTLALHLRSRLWRQPAST